MMTEYVVYKGRGDSWVELYRATDKHDAEIYFIEKAGRYGDCDRFSATLTSETMIWEQEGADPLWLTFAKESSDD